MGLPDGTEALGPGEVLFFVPTPPPELTPRLMTSHGPRRPRPPSSAPLPSLPAPAQEQRPVLKLAPGRCRIGPGANYLFAEPIELDQPSKATQYSPAAAW